MTAINEVRLEAAERDDLVGLIAELADAFGRADDPTFLRVAGDYRHRLPDRLRRHLVDLRQLESSSALWIRGGPANPVGCATPSHWRARDRDATKPHDFWLVLVCAQLGDPIGWSSLQDGRLLHDIVPVAGHELAQTGQGSHAELEIHVEDAFDDVRCDYLGLLALRNDDLVPTLIASVDDIRVDPGDLEILFEPRFIIRPDPEHGRDAGRLELRPQSVLFGAPDSPYLRVDPAYTEPQPDDEPARRAFEALCRQLVSALVPVPMAAGDLLVVDNYRAVHGRAPFQPRYDGSDRWLRKVAVTRDLRRSRARRHGVDARAVMV